MKNLNRKGNIFIISAASGTGKTTLVSRLIQQNQDIRVSISHTTRSPRAGEVNGQHYHFVNQAEFETLIGEAAFLEYAQVFGNYYGTSEKSVQDLQNQGLDVILEIDVQGAAQVRRALPHAISIFILPPSFDELAKRLRSRASDSEEVIHQRLAQARHEIDQATLFDYIVVNHELDQAQAQLNHIIQAQRLTQANQNANLIELLMSAPA